MTPALDIAKYFLCKQAPHEHDIDIMKLLKLLYYAQGYSLALRGHSMFREEIEAWKFGPVVRAVYDEYKGRGRQVLPVPRDFLPESIPDDLRNILDNVYRDKAKYSGWHLSHLTHMERPWADAWRDGNGKNSTIHIDAMYDFFSDELASYPLQVSAARISELLAQSRSLAD